MVKTGDFYKPDFSTQQVIYMEADNQRDLTYYENKLGRSTYEENAKNNAKGRSITIDWDKKKKCYDDKDHYGIDL